MRTMLVVLAMYSLAMFAEAQNAPLTLIPMPANIEMGAGQLVVDPSFSVAISGRKEPRLQRTVEIFLDHLRRQTAVSLAWPDDRRWPPLHASRRHQAQP